MSNTETREVVVSDQEVSADGLAVDWIHSNIYYTDTSHLSVKLVSWDHKHSKTLVTEDVDHPRAIAVSPMSGLVLFINKLILYYLESVFMIIHLTLKYVCNMLYALLVNTFMNKCK